MCFKKLFYECKCHKEGWHGSSGTSESPQALFTIMKSVCVRYFCSYYKCYLQWKIHTEIYLAFLGSYCHTNLPSPKHWFFWRISHATFWHSIIHTRKHEERGNHSSNNTAWLHQNDLEESVEQSENKHSETTTICSNSLSLLDLQEADTLLDNTPPSLLQLKPCDATQTSWKWEWCKISGEPRNRKAQEGNLDSIHRHWTLNGSKEMWCSKKGKKKKAKKDKTKKKPNQDWIKFLPEKNSKDKLHWFSQVH